MGAAQTWYDIARNNRQFISTAAEMGHKPEMKGSKP